MNESLESGDKLQANGKSFELLKSPKIFCDKKLSADLMVDKGPDDQPVRKTETSVGDAGVMKIAVD